MNSSQPPEQSSVPINGYSTDTDVWQAAWYGKRRWSYWLLPLTGVFVLLSALRRYVLLNWQQKTLATPVIVVGNISVGGTGKTPLLISLVQWLQAHSGPRRAPPPMGAPDAGLVPLCDAPGTYVLQK